MKSSRYLFDEFSQKASSVLGGRGIFYTQRVENGLKQEQRLTPVTK